MIPESAAMPIATGLNPNCSGWRHASYAREVHSSRNCFRCRFAKPINPSLVDSGCGSHYHSGWNAFIRPLATKGAVSS